MKPACGLALAASKGISWPAEPVIGGITPGWRWQSGRGMDCADGASSAGLANSSSTGISTQGRLAIVWRASTVLSPMGWVSVHPMGLLEFVAIDARIPVGEAVPEILRILAPRPAERPKR